MSDTRRKIINYFDELVNLRTSIQFQLNHSNYNMLKENVDLKNSLKGYRCFILGNAPSIKEQDLSMLENEFVITVNQIARVSQFPSIKTNIHFWADPGFFNEKNISGNTEFVDIMTSVNTPGNSPICFFPVFASEFINRHSLGDKMEVRYFYPGYLLTDNYNKPIDFTKPIPSGYTVVHSAIALAVYMGIKEIYLLGCDCTGIISYIENCIGTTKSGYAYEITEQEAERIKRMNENNDNETCFYAHSQIFRQYKIWLRYCESRGIKLINCSGGGILNELPREKYEQVIYKGAKYDV